MDGKDGLVLGEGEVDLSAAVYAVDRVGGENGQDHFRAQKVVGDVFGPLGAGFDALVIPDSVASGIELLDDVEYCGAVFVRVTDKI